jgi:DNA topoisomerase-1
MSLPSVRAHVSSQLKLPGLPKEKVAAIVIRLLEETMIRVGTPKYAADNGSRGLTTLETRHVSIDAGMIRFKFRGKSRKFHEVEFHDRRLAKAVRSIQELPGQPLFQFLAEDGAPQEVSSNDVNSLLKEVTSEDFSAKDFRTWGATVEAVRALREKRATGPLSKRTVREAVCEVAAKLGNTPTVCSKSYIHPRVLKEAGLDPKWLVGPLPRPKKWLSGVERLIIEQLLNSPVEPVRALEKTARRSRAARASAKTRAVLQARPRRGRK